MSLSFHALWMLCALAAVVFGASAARHPRHVAGFVTGFAAGVAYILRVGLPDPVWTGAAAATAVGIALFLPRYALIGAALGGFIPGVWTALLTVQGVPLFVAIGLAAALCVAAAWLARTREQFVPAVILDEGLLAIGLLAIATATLPSVLDGWQSASTLTAASARQAAVSIPVWTTGFLVTCASLGGAYSVWSRR